MDELMRRVAVPHLLLLLLLLQLPLLQPSNTGHQVTFSRGRQQFKGFSTITGALWTKAKSSYIICPSSDSLALVALLRIDINLGI